MTVQTGRLTRNVCGITCFKYGPDIFQAVFIGFSILHAMRLTTRIRTISKMYRFDLIYNRLVAERISSVHPCCLQALPAAEVSCLPTWDSCALATAAEPRRTSPRSRDCGVTNGMNSADVPFFGCWNRSCIKLVGASEASLHLRNCTGCGLARCVGIQ